MKQHAHGEGCVEEIEGKDGIVRHRARGPRAVGRPSWGVYATKEKAEQQLIVRRRELLAAPSTVHTLATFGPKVLDLREEDGIRSIRSERSRFRAHIATVDEKGNPVARCKIANSPLTSIQPVDIAELKRALAKKDADDNRKKRKIDRGTVRRVMQLVSSIFDEAIERGIRQDNPCTAIRTKRKRKKEQDEDVEDKWDYLRFEEQERFALCEAVPLWARLLVLFALGSGLRQGEQWNLELRDVHVDDDAAKAEGPYVFVRFGSKGKSPKNGKRRKVPLFGIALEAMQEWLELLPSYLGEYKNEHNLVFPTQRGCRRPSGAPERTVYLVTGTEPSARTGMARKTTKRGKEELLPLWLKAAGISRHIRWHDLRHTCGSSLITGVWGVRWELIDIRDLLGHSSIKVTEMYAHLGETGLKKAAAQMAHAWPTGSAGGGVASAAIVDETRQIADDPDGGPSGTRTRDLRIKRGRELSVVTRAWRINGTEKPDMGQMSKRLLELVQAGRSAEALALAVTLAAEATKSSSAAASKLNSAG